MTITGSIGSISGKFNMTGLHEKLGITHDFVARGPNALMYSSYTDFTPEQWELHTEDHWRGFNDWLRDVAEHRGMSFEEAEKLAHGRVWTGNQAVANGLIDEVGDLTQAVELAKKLAEIPADEKVNAGALPEEDRAATRASWAARRPPARRRAGLVYRSIRNDVAPDGGDAGPQPGSRRRGADAVNGPADRSDQTSGLRRTFGEFAAVDDLDLVVAPGHLLRFPRPQRRGQVHDDQDAHRTAGQERRAAPRSWAATSTAKRWRSSAGSASFPRSWRSSTG